jgi:chromosome segregation ATPase
VLQLENDALDKNIAKMIALTRKVEKEINDNLQSQASIEKGTDGTRKDANKIYTVVHEKEAVIAQVQNELSQVKLETLGYEMKLEGKNSLIKTLDVKLSEQNASIEKYELEIRRRNDELGKKQSEIDGLNKKYDLLTGKSSEDSMGPLEATIYNVSRLIEQKEKECTELSQYWIKAQNELVTFTKKSSDLVEMTQDRKMRLSILSRKKMTVNSQFDTQEREIADHKRNIRKLQNDMIKINEMLTGQANAQNHLEHNNLTLEIEFRAKLKVYVVVFNARVACRD